MATDSGVVKYFSIDRERITKQILDHEDKIITSLEKTFSSIKFDHDPFTNRMSFSFSEDSDKAYFKMWAYDGVDI